MRDPPGAAGAESQFEGHPEREGAAAGRETGQTHRLAYSRAVFRQKGVVFAPGFGVLKTVLLALVHFVKILKLFYQHLLF